MATQDLGKPDKSGNDKKLYRYLCLQNGLRLLLISDPSPIPNMNSSIDFSDYTEESEEDSVSSTSSGSAESYISSESEEGDERLAACALLVNVGSFSDPREVQGLSHFLEHMMFMGSEKFPGENSFDAFIKKCGGFSNADTECEETSFYFEVPDEYLDSSIERFVSLFINPLMKKESIARERDAVESEFQQSLQDDEQRRNQILASDLGNILHPCSIFTWGNSKTLKDEIDNDTLYQTLREYWKYHYSAHRMFCCIQARLTLNELETLAVQHFSKIYNNNLPSIDFSSFNNYNAFKTEFYENVIFAKPIANIIKVDLTWCLPALINEYRTKPHHYIAYILGHEGMGSLCAYLRKKLWALEMIVGIDDAGFEFNSMYSLFNICIHLTENGLQNLDQVLSATFSFLALLKNNGVNKELFDEVKYLEEIDFRFRRERCAFDNVQDLVINMKYFPVKDVITGPSLYFEYNENCIKNFIKKISSEKFNLMITSYIKYNDICYNRVEKWFGTEYFSMKTPKKWIEMFKNAEINSEIRYPELNLFTPHNFEIIYKKFANDVNSALPPFPKKIYDSDVFELWFRQDDKFLLPEAYMYFYFISPLALQSCKNAVLLTLFAQILKFQLVERLYPATVAGVNYLLYPSEKGIILKVNGYNEKLLLVVNIITESMKYFNENLNAQQFEVYKKSQQKNYYNSLIKPKNFNKEIRLQILQNIHWPLYEKYNSLRDLSLEEVKNFAINMPKEMKIQALIQGNMTEEEAHIVMKTILESFSCTKIKDTKSIESRTCKLPIGSNTVACQTINDQDSNSVTTNFYQIGQSTIRLQCSLDLLIMIIEEPLFDKLRTKEQLGYDVSASVRNNFGILGYSITVNSQENKFSSSFVHERIEAFRKQMMIIVQKIENDEFEHIKESLITTKQEADNELKDEVLRNWDEIVSEEYIFDRIKKEIDCLRTITKKELIDFCHQCEKSLKKLSVQVRGNKCDFFNKELSSPIVKNENERSIELKVLNEDTTIRNIKEFKKNLEKYPVNKTVLD